MRKKHKLDSTTIELFNLLLGSNVIATEYQEGGLVEKFTVTVGAYEVDYILVNGTKDSGPWMDVIVYDNDGNEAYIFPPDREKVNGEYIFEIDKKVFTLEIA